MAETTNEHELEKRTIYKAVWRLAPASSHP